MSKNHRGKGLLEKYRRGRATCPICMRTGIKVIHEREIEKQKIEVCKICNATLSRKEILLKKQVSSAESKKTEATVKETVKETVVEKETKTVIPPEKETATEETSIENTQADEETTKDNTTTEQDTAEESQADEETTKEE